MIYISGYNCPARCNFTSNKFWSYKSWYISTKAFTGRHSFLCTFSHIFTTKVFTFSNVYHLLCNNTCFRKLILSNHFIIFTSQRGVFYRKFASKILSTGSTIIFRFHRTTIIKLNTPTTLNPFCSKPRKAFFYVNYNIWIRVRP